MANHDDVASWEGALARVDQAVDEFGRLDVLVNNAGILRDSFVASMDESQWDAVIAVHLKGHAAPLRHAAAYWKARTKAGEHVNDSMISTSSASGTFMPNAGEANYGAAKVGIAAIALVAADELERFGVRVTAIARTRLTLATPAWVPSSPADVPEGDFDAFDPASIFMAAFWLISAGDLSTLDKIGLAISIGAIGGIGINTAHELGHKKDSHKRWLSKIALAQSFYGHFYIEHNRGHHVRVATPEDPASSRFGENFYQFWPRTVGGSLKSAWNIEKKRYARKKQHPFRIGNDVLNAWVMSAVLWGAMIAWLGVGIVPYLLIQAVIGFSLLEVVNYMEHYGMLRQKVGAPGKERYERVAPSHSWNSNNIATNVLLYHLQRHSDHHANPTRRYQTLRDFEESPVLPTGYAGMIVLALFPPVWRKVMDPRVLAHFNGDLSRANLSPRKRDKILARYPAPKTSLKRL